MQQLTLLSKSNAYGESKLLRILTAISLAPNIALFLSDFKSFKMTVNSSPPILATVSVSRTELFSLSAASINIASPNLCPYISFANLNLSKSINSNAL